MKRTGIIAILLSAVLLSLAAFSSCSFSKMRQFSHTDVTVFDTQTVILGFEETEEEFQKRAEEIMESLGRYHKLYDIYYSYEGVNNLKTVNDNAGVAPVKVEREIIDLLLYSKEMYELTDTMTNVAMGAVLRLWHQCREEGLKSPEAARLPEREELLAAAEHCDIEKVIIDEEEGTVFLSDGEMSLDVGAVAKGFAVEAVARRLESEGLSGYALSVGGNVRCIGKKATGEKWEIGVQNPDMLSDKAYFTKVYLERESLVTSGTYQRFYTVEGKTYHHIIHPETLMPKDTYASVSVIAPHSGMADALSTALFNMSIDEGLALAESLSGVEAAWVYPDGDVRTTKGFDDFEKK